MFQDRVGRKPRRVFHRADSQAGWNRVSASPEYRLSEKCLDGRQRGDACGASPLQKVRIDKANKLLLASGLALKAIACEVGYESVSFFVRLFKTHAGQTPPQWRQCEAVSAP